MNLGVIAACLFVFTFFTTNQVRAGWTVGGLLPNPVGSDSHEWVWLRRDTLVPTVDSDWWLRDVVGTPRVASLAAFLKGEGVVISASQSAIALNNTGDQIELWGGSELRQLTPLYPTAAEGMVWTDKEGEWQFVPEAEFWDWVQTGQWGVKNVNQALPVASGGANIQREVSNNKPTLTLQDVDKPADIPIPAKPSENNPNNKYLNISNYFKTPQLYQTASESAKKDVWRPSYPDYDWEQENMLYYHYIRQNNIAIGMLLVGGLMCLAATSPYWWQRYQRDW